MSAKRLWRYVAVSLIAAGPAGGFIFGLLNAGDPDPNPIGRLFYACIMAVATPLHAGFPPHHEAGAGQSFNAWPHIAVSFLLILSWFVHRDWKLSKKRKIMSNIQPNRGPITWPGDMCFGIISSKCQSTTLTASSDGLILEGPLGKTFRLPFSKVRLVETGKSSVWFLEGQRTGCIQIHHEVEGVPELLLFSASGIPAAEVAQELKKLGYEAP